jgi:hypothetical protein
MDSQRPHDDPEQTRREFLGRLGGAGVMTALGTYDPGATRQAPAQGVAWDTSWIERVRRAPRRAVFDAPNAGIVLDLAARWLDGVKAVHGERAAEAASAVAVLNIRTRAIGLALSDAMWAQFPLGEEYKVDDPLLKAPSRRNVDWRRSGSTHALATTVEEIQRRGGILIVCDFALGHLATRLAQQAGREGPAVHAELRAGLVPGAILVPSGIYGAAEAQLAGCAFIPA